MPRWPLLVVLVVLAAPSLTACAGDEGESTSAASGASASITASGITTTISTTATSTAGSDGSSTGGSGSEGTSAAATSSGGDDTGGVKFDVAQETTGGATTGPDDSLCPCGDKLDLIYVLSDDRQLWTYDPMANAFAMVGPLGCPTQNGTFSMGVGRDGFAWVQDTALVDVINQTYIGDLYRLDVTNPQNCTDPGYTPGAGGWIHFGMAFVSHSESDPCDDLYGQHWNGVAGLWSEGPGVGKLGKFDPVALQMNTIGATDYNGAELTGTGDGRIYAFGGVPDAKLIQFDKATAQAIETIPFAGFPLTNAFAFAFWGGDFYFFTEANAGLPGTKSKVTRLDYDGDKSLTTVNAGAPIRVVGAGVSTCAPIMPPG